MSEITSKAEQHANRLIEYVMKSQSAVDIHDPALTKSDGLSGCSRKNH